MGKQTMGTPCHSLPFRGDNKLYRIQVGNNNTAARVWIMIIISQMITIIDHYNNYSTALVLCEDIVDVNEIEVLLFVLEGKWLAKLPLKIKTLKRVKEIAVLLLDMYWRINTSSEWRS